MTRRARWKVFYACLLSVTVALFLFITNHVGGDCSNKCGSLPYRIAAGDDIIQGHGRNITVVTLYFNIGNFRKGNGDVRGTHDKYKNWMKSWASLTNDVIGFFDDDEILEYFRSIRSSQPADRSLLIKLNRTDLDSFKYLRNVRDIYSSPVYPRHSPNTVSADYSCTMDAKYDVIQIALDLGLVRTKYIAWLDIGYFRDMVDRPPQDRRFRLEVPEDFNASRVAFSEVTPRSDLVNATPWHYIKFNHVWVAGGLFLGTAKVIEKFLKSYKSTRRALLARGLSSTDQQVIGAMYSPEFLPHQQVDIMAYTCRTGQYGLYGSQRKYFCLGYTCVRANVDRQVADALYEKLRYITRFI
ncbi:unnamed protein product [Lymnaea stagnalis]|uniref:Uncharacterized protein n=1 Tax=Lymnaea stagnalis TaxID=6523 RepID=A0AAV2HJT8_LYMST